MFFIEQLLLQWMIGSCRAFFDVDRLPCSTNVAQSKRILISMSHLVILHRIVYLVKIFGRYGCRTTASIASVKDVVSSTNLDVSYIMALAHWSYLPNLEILPHEETNISRDTVFVEEVSVEDDPILNGFVEGSLRTRIPHHRSFAICQ